MLSAQGKKENPTFCQVSGQDKATQHILTSLSKMNFRFPANMGMQKFVGVVSMMIMLAMAWGPMQGTCSNFFTYAGPGCNNLVRKYSACGCSNIASDTHGGYRFTYQGQTAAAYNTANCQGVVHTYFSGSVRGCSGFGWKSFFIQC